MLLVLLLLLSSSIDKLQLRVFCGRSSVIMGEPRELVRGAEGQVGVDHARVLRRLLDELLWTRLLLLLLTSKVLLCAAPALHVARRVPLQRAEGVGLRLQP